MACLQWFNKLSFFWQKFFHILIVAIIFTSIYSLAGNYYLGTPNKLPVTWIDSNCPFLLWTFWIYISDYFFLVIAGLITPDYRYFFRFQKAFWAIVSFHIAIFLICPTSISRPAITGSDISSKIGQIIQIVDNTTNCFPSLHVSLTFLAAFIVIKISKILWIPSMFWAIAIAISTLTTKQHYFYDVIGGTLISVIFFTIFFRDLDKKINSDKAK